MSGSYTIQDISSDWQVPLSALEGIEVLAGGYSYENYSGYAFVLFRKDGKLYETHGSHCSCYGLAGQWDPEETDEASIRHRLSEGRHPFDQWTSEVRALFPND